MVIQLAKGAMVVVSLNKHRILSMNGEECQHQSGSTICFSCQIRNFVISNQYTVCRMNDRQGTYHRGRTVREQGSSPTLD